MQINQGLGFVVGIQIGRHPNDACYKVKLLALPTIGAKIHAPPYGELTVYDIHHYPELCPSGDDISGYAAGEIIIHCEVAD